MSLVRADAIRIPLRDESVDLVVTSPPYFALRSYRDGGEHFAGQIGSEATPQAFLEALWAVTAECMRVLKPSGSIFVNLGDKYSGSGGPGGDYNAGGLRDGQPRVDAQSYWSRMAPRNNGIRAKSLMLLPERYRIGCVDRLGLIAREVIVWHKANSLPESVQDRCRRSHEDWVHLTKEGRYFAAMDEIREEHAPSSLASWPKTGPNFGGNFDPRNDPVTQDGHRGTACGPNPLGSLPGSVWRIPSEPLTGIPELMVEDETGWRMMDRRRAWRYAFDRWHGGNELPVVASDSPDHFAAFPGEWPRRLILGWSPSGICVACGDGRRPVVVKPPAGGFVPDPSDRLAGASANGSERNKRYREVVATGERPTITGHTCSCSTPDAPTRPSVILDPFAGTGTTVMVAKALGRFGVGLDLSNDYLRLARWRIEESGHGGKSVRRTFAERNRQVPMFDTQEATADAQ